MEKNIYYDLYQLRQLTESIFCLRQELGNLDKEAIEYKRAVELYEDLWRERDKVENRITNMCNKKMKSGFVIAKE